MKVKFFSQHFFFQATQFVFTYKVLNVFLQMSSIMKFITLLIVLIDVCCGQVVNAPLTYVGDPRHARVVAQGPPIAFSHPAELSHPGVVANSIAESQLPIELQKSHRFYSDPHVADALARDSWLTDKEAPVFEREADKIPREQVFKIFKNAGFLERRRRFARFH